MFCLYNTSNLTCFTFFCSQKKVTKKTCSVFKYFLYFVPDADYNFRGFPYPP